MWRPSPLAVAGCALVLAALGVTIASAFEQADGAGPPPPPVTLATPTPTPSPSPTATPVPPAPPPAGPGLAIGVTEFNANLVASPADRSLPAPWAGVRDALGAIRPDYFRLVIDWASLQPTADAPANFSAPHAGCMRATGPCLGWAGVHDQLRALASRQREGGWQALVVVTSTPDWAAAPAGGCERGRRHSPLARAAGGRAAGLPGTDRRRARGRGTAGRGSALLEPVERAEPPGVHQPPAPGV